MQGRTRSKYTLHLLWTCVTWRGRIVLRGDNAKDECDFQEVSKLVKLLETECPQVWVRLPRNRRPVSRSGSDDELSVGKVAVHTSGEAVHSGLISADGRAQTDLADCVCKLVVLLIVLLLVLAARRAADLAETCMSHWVVRVGSTLQRFDADDVWLCGRG